MIKLVQIPKIIRGLFPSLIWHKERNKKKLYLTFDDGPHKVLTPFILRELKKNNAMATFFFVGSQVDKYPELVKLCLNHNHKIGNHTYSHLNGWESKNIDYYRDIEKAKNNINSNLFRPPYGKLKLSQLKVLKNQFKLIMWDVLSWDFDPNTTSEKCYKNIIKNTKNGSIIVMHENDKSIHKVKQVLPKLLKYYKAEGYAFEVL